MQAISVHMS